MKKNILKFKKIKLLKLIINSKIFIAIIFSFLGAFIATLIYANQSNVMAKVKDNNYLIEDENYNKFKALNNIEDNFFDHDDFFDEMMRVRANFDRIFENRRRHFEKIFKENHQQINYNNKNYYINISKEQIEDKLIYLVNHQGYDYTDFNIRVEKNFLVIEAKKKDQKNDQDNNGHIKSIFDNNIYYSFLLPQNIKSKTPEIKQEKNLIKIIFTYN